MTYSLSTDAKPMAHGPLEGIMHSRQPRTRSGGVLLLCALALPAVASAQGAPATQRGDDERAPAHARPQPIQSRPPPPPVQWSPQTFVAVRSTAASLTIALSAAAIIGFTVVDGHPSGERQEWTDYLLIGALGVGSLTHRYRLLPRRSLPPSHIAVALEGIASPLALTTLGVALGELTDRPRDLWVGALVAAGVYNTFNTLLVWGDAASDPVSLWVSVGVGVASSVGGVALATSEPDRETAGVSWVFTALSIAATAHQTVWAILGRTPEPAVAPVPRRASLAPTVLGRGLGVALTGVW